MALGMFNVGVIGVCEPPGRLSKVALDGVLGMDRIGKDEDQILSFLYM